MTITGAIGRFVRPSAVVKVAMLAPIAWRTPPLHYGPWEQVTSLITEGLVALGIDVTLFATGDSVTSAELDSVCAVPYAENPDMDGRVWEALHVAHALQPVRRIRPRAQQPRLAAVEFLRALRGPDGHHHPRLLQPGDPAGLPGGAGRPIVSISDSDRVPDLDYAATVYHGIDLAALPFSADGGEDLVILGRIHPDKGTAEAIEIARLAGRRLVICGIVQDAEYFAERVQPHIDDDAVVYLGSVGPEQRAAVLGHRPARCCIRSPSTSRSGCPSSSRWPAAHRLSPTAVARCRRSSTVGQTGFLVDDPVAAAMAVNDVADLDRVTCRAVAERRFSAERMVADYVAVYEQVLRRGG